MKTETIIQGKAGEMMGQPYFRLIPEIKTKTVGSFFLLDHIYERSIEPRPVKPLNGSTAHPHRGIITATYLLEGENEHHDSLGNKQIVTSGGLQWMNSGNGIVHDEGMTENLQQYGGKVHLMQFWILLPALNRIQAPSYMALENDKINETIIDNNGSRLRVLIGNYENTNSSIPTLNHEFLYHINLKKGSNFFYTKPEKFELGIFTAKGQLNLNNSQLNESSLLVNKAGEQTYHLKNNTNEEIHIMLFGGLPYTEQFYAQGPFVMGNPEEIKKAYSDFYNNKYGEISYAETD